MLIRIRKLVLYVLLALMPLQSVAGAVQAVFCDDAIQHASASGSQHHDSDDGRHHHDDPDDQSSAAAHDGCQHYFSAVLPGFLWVVGQTLLTPEPGGSVPFSSYFPEQLKRPPLALAA